MKKSKTAWLLTTAGIIFAIIGIYCFISPSNAYIKMVKYSGAALLVHGFLLISVSFIHTSSLSGWKKERTWMHAESIIEFLFGILLLVNPVLSFFVFPLLIGYCVLTVGILKIAASLSLRNNIRGWLFIVVMGALLCIFGLLIVYYPFAKAADVTFLLGIFALTMGTITLFDSFRFRNRKETVNMML